MLMIRTIIDIKKNAVFNNITNTLVQFKVLDRVLLVFKNLYDIQKKEVECIKLQKHGVQKYALSLQLPYVMNFLQTNGIDCNNLLEGIQQLIICVIQKCQTKRDQEIMIQLQTLQYCQQCQLTKYQKYLIPTI